MRLAYKAVPKDASRRQRYSGASLYLIFISIVGGILVNPSPKQIVVNVDACDLLVS